MCFSICYHNKFFTSQGVLRIHVTEAKELKKADISLTGKGKSDPYAVVRGTTFSSALWPCPFDLYLDLDLWLWWLKHKRFFCFLKQMLHNPTIIVNECQRFSLKLNDSWIWPWPCLFRKLQNNTFLTPFIACLLTSGSQQVQDSSHQQHHRSTVELSVWGEWLAGTLEMKLKICPCRIIPECLHCHCQK